MLSNILKLSIVRRSRTILLKLVERLTNLTIAALPKMIKEQHWLPMDQVTINAFVKNMATRSVHPRKI